MTSEDTTTPLEDAFCALLRSIDPARPRVVVRFIDETRIVSEGESGYTVGPVSSVMITSFHDGAPRQTTFEGFAIRRARQILATFPLDVLYRSDNIT
jgi:hypothetical protein